MIMERPRIRIYKIGDIYVYECKAVNDFYGKKVISIRKIWQVLKSLHYYNYTGK